MQLINIKWIACTAALTAIATTPVLGQSDAIVHVGAGSYRTTLPKDASGPPSTTYTTPEFQHPLPSNDWMSSILSMKYSSVMYPHPLAVMAQAEGLRVDYPGPSMKVEGRAAYTRMPGVAMPAQGVEGIDTSAHDKRDFIIGHSAVASFPDARLAAASDWFITAEFRSGDATMRTTFGHGNPFVYVRYTGGEPVLTFRTPPALWSGDARSAILAASVNGSNYAFFAPSGSTWSGIGTSQLRCDTHGKGYLSCAVLPDATQETLALFTRYAYDFVTDSRVSWKYEEGASRLRTTYAVTTTAMEGDNHGTIFALYPHQWANTGDELLTGEYQSARGTMRLLAGDKFTTTMTYPGVLPGLPVAGVDRDRLRKYLAADTPVKLGTPKDTYFEGKDLGGIANLIPVAEEADDSTAASALIKQLENRLQDWFTATDATGKAKEANLFYHDSHWGALIGYPASFGSDARLNDHHFHYGYFLRAAAEVARHDPDWAKANRWGGMVDLLVRDIADSDRNDPDYPFLRNFDPYAGHSWAAGIHHYTDGNNQESSSEAMNAWTGMILWGEATGNTKVRDLGIYLYTTEMNAIDEYWFDVHHRTFPKNYPYISAGMIWGAAIYYGTWFSNDPEAVHGINWLPFHGGSLYLGRYPAYARANYDAMAAERGGTKWHEWDDLIWLYRALSDPTDALKQFDAVDGVSKYEGNTRSFTYAWIGALNAYGTVDASVTANTPLYAVFKKGSVRTYCVYSDATSPVAVTFSDGAHVMAKPQTFTVLARAVPQ